MATTTNNPVLSSTSVLSLTLEDLRERRYPGGAACPYCGSWRMVRWGRFAGRQRYRCRVCLRTCSDFTGTPMYYSKRATLWPGYAICLLERLSLRAAATRLGIDKDTAWRWRHRLLEASARGAPRSLRGAVETLELRLPLIDTRGAAADHWEPIAPGRRARKQARGQRVLIARDEAGAVAALVTGWRRGNAADYEVLLARRVARIRILIAADGSGGPAARFARARRLDYARHFGLSWDGRPASPYPSIDLRGYARRLRAWLRRFRGIAARYLLTYLHWYQLMYWADESSRRLLLDAQRAPPSTRVVGR